MQKKKLAILVVIFFLGLALFGCELIQRETLPEEDDQKDEPEVVVIKEETGDQEKMKLDEYIAGVVAGEMKPNWPENAYAAQAIIARTFALDYLKRKGTNQISSSFEEAQAYKPQDVTDVIKKAVEKTRGEAILYDGEYIRAWFHASAGGKTTTAKSGLAFTGEEPPYIHSVSSPDELAPEEIKNWRAEFENGAIADALTQVAGVQANQITEMKVVEKDDTGRATKIEISYDGGSKTVEASEFRNALDPVKCKSTMIKGITKSGNSFILEGSGFGHGVGMSQWGAYKMAKDGKSPEEIVDYYYKDIEIKIVYE